MIPVSTKLLWGLCAFPEPLCLRVGDEVMEMELLGVNLALPVPFTSVSSGCMDLVMSSQPMKEQGKERIC